MPGFWRLFALALLLSAAEGCYPVTHLQGPRTVAPGKLQGAAAVGVQGIDGEGLPVDLAVRYGAHDRIDLSARVRLHAVEPWNSGIELGGKFQLVRGNGELSIAASLLHSAMRQSPWDDSMFGHDRLDVFAGRVSVLLGTDADSSGALWIAPTLDLGTRRFHDDDISRSAPLVALGGAAGVAIRLSRDVQLLVQGGLMTGVAGKLGVPSNGYTGGPFFRTLLDPGRVIVEGSLGLLWGGSR